MFHHDTSVILAKMLNKNAGKSVPTWFSTAAGLAIPQAWIGLTIDVASNLIDTSGENKRIFAANVAGKVSRGGVIGIVEQTIKSGKKSGIFSWKYVYVAELNKQKQWILLHECKADIHVQ